MDDIWRRFVNIVGNQRSGEAPQRSLGRVLLSGHSFEGRAASCTKRVLVDGWWMILKVEKGFYMGVIDVLWCLMIFLMMSYDFFLSFLWCFMMFYGGSPWLLDECWLVIRSGIILTNISWGISESVNVESRSTSNQFFKGHDFGVLNTSHLKSFDVG